MNEQATCLEKLYDFNATRPSQGEKRQELLKEMFAEIGEGCYIEPPFHANWGGKQEVANRRLFCCFKIRNPCPKPRFR